MLRDVDGFGESTAFVHHPSATAGPTGRQGSTRVGPAGADAHSAGALVAVGLIRRDRDLSLREIIDRFATLTQPAATGLRAHFPWSGRKQAVSPGMTWHVQRGHHIEHGLLLPWRQRSPSPDRSTGQRRRRVRGHLTHWIACIAALEVPTIENSGRRYRLDPPQRSSSVIGVVCAPVQPPPPIASAAGETGSAEAEPQGARDRAVHDIVNPATLIAA